MIVSVVSLKGGVAKTTTAMFLAACAAEDGHDSVVLDADSEMSAIGWAQLAPDLPFRVARADLDGLIKQARELSRAGTTVFVDTPPNSREILLSAGAAADIAVVPVAPSAIDINRLARTIRVLIDIGEMRSDLIVRLLFTRVSRGTRLARVAAEVFEEYPTFDSVVRDLERYKAAGGTTPTYLTEYRNVWHEIKVLVGAGQEAAEIAKGVRAS